MSDVEQNPAGVASTADQAGSGHDQLVRARRHELLAALVPAPLYFTEPIVVAAVERKAEVLVGLVDLHGQTRGVRGNHHELDGLGAGINACDLVERPGGGLEGEPLGFGKDLALLGGKD